MSEMLRERALDDANRWVAQFAPLIMEEQILTADKARERIKTAQALRRDAAGVQGRLANIATAEDEELKQTLSRAIEQLDSVENDLRLRLGRLEPGDPNAVADLDAVSDKLAERLARQEVGVPTELAMPSSLKMRTANGNKAQAGFLGLFAFGWLSFTTVHATLMIGGMAKALGWAALGLLGFYAIFFAVGIGMLIGAFNSACREEIELDGRELTITKQLGGYKKSKKVVLGSVSRAVVGETQTTFSSTGRNRQPKYIPCITISDAEGNAVNLGAGSPPDLLAHTAEKMNAHLVAQA